MREYRQNFNVHCEDLNEGLKNHQPGKPAPVHHQSHKCKNFKILIFRLKIGINIMLMIIKCIKNNVIKVDWIKFKIEESEK